MSPHHDGGGDDDARARAHAALDALAIELRQTFGWAELPIRIEITGRALVLAGEVVAARVRTRIRDAIASALPGRDIDVRGVVLRRGAAWHALPPGITALWRRAVGPRELATELAIDDGPVERIAEGPGATLVRAPDGTLGWTDRTLGSIVAPPVLGSTGPFARERLAEVPARWLDVPYRLGGTTTSGVDCSGLVQRALAELGMRVPRHSRDQFAVTPRDGEGDDEIGALVFVWAKDEAPCHVALALGDGTVVHASRSRARVVVDARADLFVRSHRVAHVCWGDLVALQARLRGCTSLVEAIAIGSD